MRRFHTCVCSTLHLPVEERRFIEDLIAARREGRSVGLHTDLTIVPHHDGYMIHVGILEDHADRPANVPSVLWNLLGHAVDEGASWLSFDREEIPCSGLATYPDDPPPASAAPARTIRCKACGGAAFMRDAWARWDEAAQAWALGEVYDEAFCEICEADATLVEVPIAAPALEQAA